MNRGHWTEETIEKKKASFLATGATAETGKLGTSKAAAAHRRRLFIEAYIGNAGNATQAAIAAGYPRRSAHVRGAELVKDRKTATELDRRRAEAAEKAMMGTHVVLVKISRIARANLADCYRPDGRLKPLEEWDENAKAALAQLETEETVTETGVTVQVHKVRLIKRTEALEMLMKHYGAYERNNRQKADPIREFMEAVSGHSRGLPAQRKRLDETGAADHAD